MHSLRDPFPQQICECTDEFVNTQMIKNWKNTYGPRASRETHGVGHTPHRRGEVEVVIIAVDQACSLAPQRAIVRIVILFRPVVAEAKIEAVVAFAGCCGAPPTLQAVRPAVVLAAVRVGIQVVRVSVSVRMHLKSVGTRNWWELQ